jgi:hypothetical protein
MMNWKGSGWKRRYLTEVLSQHSPVGTEKISEDPQEAGVPSVIGIEHLSNIDLGRYRYTNMFGLFIITSSGY